MTYKFTPIPEGATKIWISINGCGPECCDATTVSIWSDKRMVWEFDTIFFSFDDEYDKDLEILRQEVKDACEHYGIVPIDIEDNCIYDWEGERIL